MAKFDGVDLRIEDGGGAILEIASGKTDGAFSYRMDGGGEVILPAKGEVAIVRSLDVSDCGEALREAREAANRALDMSLLRGGVPLFLDHHKQPVIVWWKNGPDATLRIVSATSVTVRFSVSEIVRSAQGDLVPGNASPQDDWDESMRFYRVSEASNDLYDSFRNLYLAIEALLSKVSAPEVGPNGHEKEGSWLKRVLRQVHPAVNLAPFAPQSNKAPENAISDELYGALRTAIFHAKRGRSVWLPQEWGTRDRIAEARARYAGMYRALAHEYLGMPFTGSSFSAQVFAAMTGAIFDEASVYVSDDPTRHLDEPEGDYGIAPAGGGVLSLTTLPATEYATEYTAGVIGAEPGDTIMASIHGVRRFGTVKHGQLGMVENLKAALDTSGIKRVEVVLLANHRNHGGPRRDFDY